MNHNLCSFFFITLVLTATSTTSLSVSNTAYIVILTDSSWNPNVSCTAIITTLSGVIGGHFNSSTGGAFESGGPFGVLETPIGTSASITDLEESISPPCNYPNVNGTTAGVFVEIRGLTLQYSGSKIEDNTAGGKCGRTWSGADGGQPYSNGGVYCNTYGILADPSRYTYNCESLMNISPKICIRIEIARDWKAAGYCGLGTVCDNATLNTLNLIPTQKIDVQGFVAWHPPSSSGHGFSSWELHPLTAFRFE